MAKTITPLKNVTPVVVTKPWPKQTEIDSMARQLDRLVRYDARLSQAMSISIRNRPLDDLQSLLDEFDTTGQAKGREHLESTLNALEPAEWRDEDWNLQASAVSSMLAILVGSFPTSNLPDAPVFTRVMLDDVMALEPDFVVLEGACRKLRQSSKFMPSISEIVEAIKAEKKAWSRRYTALDCVEDSHAELTKLVNDERERRERLSLPFKEGDQVRHDRLGDGRVVCVNEGSVEVDFASGRRRVVHSFVTRIPS